MDNQQNEQAQGDTGTVVDLGAFRHEETLNELKAIRQALEALAIQLSSGA